jgi:hypothetical protein
MLAAPIEHLARRRLWLGLELRSPIAECVERNPASLAVLTSIELARDMTLEFPGTCKKLPVLRNIVPVSLRRELREKWLQRSGFLL